MELSWKYYYTFCESLQLLHPHPQASHIVGILQLEKCRIVLSQLRPWSRSPLTSGSTLVPNSVPASTWIFLQFICHTAARVMFVTFESDYPTLLLKSSNPYFPFSLSANWVTCCVCVCVYIPLILYVLGIPHLLYFPLYSTPIPSSPKLPFVLGYALVKSVILCISFSNFSF